MRDSASAASFLHPDICRMSPVNSEMNDKWRHCLGDFSVKSVMAVVNGLWYICM